jgi:hypothetical protein
VASVRYGRRSRVDRHVQSKDEATAQAKRLEERAERRQRWHREATLNAA